MPTKKTGRRRGRPTKKPSPFGEKPDLTDKRWRGLKREFLGIKGHIQSDGWPSLAKLHSVAKAAGVTERAVRHWRDDEPEYLRGLWWLIAERLSEKLVADDPTEPDSKPTDQQRAALLHAFVKSNWTGPIQTMISEAKREDARQREREVAEQAAEQLAEQTAQLPLEDRVIRLRISGRSWSFIADECGISTNEVRRIHAKVYQLGRADGELPDQRKVYLTIDDYVAHLLDKNVVPMPDGTVKKKSE